VPVGLDAGQEDIFREVIPDGSAKALSRYTDMVDALIREQNDRLAGASDDARLRLRERDLPDCLLVSPLLRPYFAPVKLAGSNTSSSFAIHPSRTGILELLQSALETKLGVSTLRLLLWLNRRLLGAGAGCGHGFRAARRPAR
jgi:hypothetical protein